MAELKPSRHRYKPGESGNPKGRPRKTATIDELISVAAPAIVERAIAAALAGDMYAASVVLGLMKGRGR